MQEESLHIKNFQYANELSVSKMPNMPTVSAIGYFVQLDLEYPACVKDERKDYPVAPGIEIALNAWLSN